MPRITLALLPALAVLSTLSPNALGATAADFPLRVHVYQTRWQKHPGGAAEGEGRANLFEHGQPRGFNYSFKCSELFRASMGWETYPPARSRSAGSCHVPDN